MNEDCFNCLRGCVACGWQEQHEMCVQDCGVCDGRSFAAALQRGIERRD